MNVRHPEEKKLLAFFEETRGREFTEAQIDAARELWEELYTRFGSSLLPPQAIAGPDGSLELSWSPGWAPGWMPDWTTACIEVAPDGSTSWWAWGSDHAYTEGDQDVARHVGDMLAIGRAPGGCPPADPENEAAVDAIVAERVPERETTKMISSPYGTPEIEALLDAIVKQGCPPLDDAWAKRVADMIVDEGTAADRTVEARTSSSDPNRLMKELEQSLKAGNVFGRYRFR